MDLSRLMGIRGTDASFPLPTLQAYSIAKSDQVFRFIWRDISNCCFIPVRVERIYRQTLLERWYNITRRGVQVCVKYVILQSAYIEQSLRNKLV